MLIAQVFKTRIDPFVQKLSFLRIFSGTLKKDQNVPASTARKGVKMGQLLQVQASETAPVDEAGPGDIVAVVGPKELRTGTTLSALAAPVLLEEMTFPDPVIYVAIEPRTKLDQEKLGSALSKLVREDPTFRVDDQQPVLHVSEDEVGVEYVGDRRQACRIHGVPRLDQRVFDETGTGLIRIVDAQVALRHDLRAELGEDPPDLPDLAGIAGGENDLCRQRHGLSRRRSRALRPARR